MIKHVPTSRAATRCLLAVLVILFLLGSSTNYLFANEAAPQSDGESALTQLQDSFANLDEYQFTAQVEQTLIPRATAANIGRSEERIDSQLNGTITPEKNTLDLRFEGNNMPNLLLEQVDGQTFLVQDGERTLIENPLAASAPDGSFDGYLHAATNLVERSDPNFPNYTIYQFELDGQAFADYLFEQIQASLTANQNYQVYAPAHAAAMMSGTGELWLDNEGVLRRQIMDIAIPEVNDQYDLQSNIVVDYRYDNEASANYGLPNEVTPTASEKTTSADFLPSAPVFTLEFLYYLAAIALGLGFVYIMLRQPRKLRVVLPLLLVLLMVASPILQPAAHAAHAAAIKDSTPPSLSDILGGSQEKKDMSVLSKVNATTSLLEQSEATCGVGDDTTSDSDGDGLTDFVENCLGTSPYMADTDSDYLSDLQEVNGFVFTDTVKGPITYYSNPLEPDSNFDGRSDFYEWPIAETLNPDAEWDQSFWDTDLDNEPNLWDIDDDGDGVYDALDLNPEYVTEFKDFFRLTLYQEDGTQPGTYQTIDFQVQPEDLDHLRYTTTSLDWPDGDDLGPLQDVDNSKDDIVLSPFLKVYTTHIPPQEIMNLYGIITFTTDVADYYYMYVPLTPIGDGGRIEAFAGKVVYDLGQIDGQFGWRDSKLTWLAHFNYDDGSTGLIAEYEEDGYRFAGLDITRQKNYDFAVLGTPNSPDNNRQLYQLMAALGPSFLGSYQVTLNELESRFNTPTTPLTKTWGIPADDVTVLRPATAPGFLDKMPVDIASSLEDYLYSNGYPFDDLASLIVASEGEIGTMSLGDDPNSEIYLDQRTLKVKLYDLPMAWVRSANMAFLTYGNSGWGTAEPAEVGEALVERYDLDAIASSLEAVYPGIDKSDLIKTIALTNLNFEEGGQALVKYGDLIMVSLMVDDAAVREVVDAPGANDIFSYILDVGGIGLPGEGLAFDSYEQYKYHRYELPSMLNWGPQEMVYSLLGSKVITIAYLHQIKALTDANSTNNLVAGNSQNSNSKGILSKPGNFDSLPGDESARVEFDYNMGHSDPDVDMYRYYDLEGEFELVREGATPRPTPNSGQVYHEDNLAQIAGEQDIDDILPDELFVPEGTEGALPGTPTGGAKVKYDLDPNTLGELDADQLDLFNQVETDGVEDFNTRYPDAVDDIIGNDPVVDDIDFDAPGLNKADDVAEAGASFSKMAKVVKGLKTVLTVAGVVLEVAGLAWDLTTIWMTYANFQSIYGYERTEALAYAITATVILVVVAVLSIAIAPLGFAFMMVDLMFLLADLIGLAAYGKWESSREAFLKGLFSSFYDASSLTKVVNWDWRGLRLSKAGPLKVGEKLTIEDLFTGVIQASYQDTVSDLAESSSFGYFNVKSYDENITISPWWDSESQNCSDNPTFYYDSAANTYYTHSKVCKNYLEANVHFNGPIINGKVSLQHVASFDTRYEECIFGYSCKTKTDTAVLPNELPKENQWGFIDITLDVLPGTLTELFNWSELSIETSDSDADGITDEDEIGRYNTDDKNWDTDGDSLSDGYEVFALEALNAFATNADSDHDGLNDGIEFRIGTLIGDEDTDDDGILDGDEFPHYDADTGLWVHGGGFVTIDGADYFMFSSPYAWDLDGDGISDSNELASGAGPVTTAHTTALKFNTSPAAANGNVPSIVFTASPLQKAPGADGRVGVYVGQGDAMTATLHIDDNYTASAVDGFVKICLPDAGWDNMAVQTSGSRPNIATISNGNCYIWDFNSAPLASYEEFTAVVTGIAGTNASITSSITIDVPYSNIDGSSSIKDSIAFTLDNDAPTVTILEPRTDTRLAGDYFVMGGSSDDPSSWVEYVKVTVPSGTYTATDSTPWSYTWELPDDGVVDVYAVAYDAVGNASQPFPVQVTVDSLAPVITTNFANGATIAAGESYSNTIQLNGTVSDNYSGVVRVQLAYNNQPWRTIWSSETPQTNTTWSGEWVLPAITENAQGEHTLRLRAWDDFGNIGLLEQTVFVDLLPPTNEMTDRRFTAETIAHVPLNQPLDLQGVANDAGRNPLASGPIALEGTLDSFDDATVWLQPDTYEADDAGVTVAWIGDYNGDRLGDLAVGFPNSSDGRGKVVIVTGQAGDWPNPNLGEMEQLFGKTPTFLGIDGAGLGATIVPAGDFNGDGFEDMLIGDLANNRVFLVYGTAVPQGSELLLDDMNLGYWDVISSESETFTSQFASAGDVNNDSYPDILIATDSNVYLLVGDNTPSVLLDLAGAILPAGNASVAGVGDVTGDFIDDFAVATGGTVYLFAGGSGWIKGGLSGLTTSMAIASFATSDATPTLIGAGDINNDGFADFAFSDASSPVVVYGSDSGSYATETLGGFASALSGFLAAAGDTNKDGNSDLLVGNADGDAYLLLGGNLGTAAATIENVAGSASAPYTKGADLVGDGSADLLIVPSNSSSFVSGLPEAQPAFIPLSALPQRSPTATSTGAPSASGDVTVGDGDADYASIQAAIDSGADRVLIQPGVYYEAITLTNDVIVAGSGAGLTTLMMPDGETVLVKADNVSNTALLNLSLKGDGTGTGIAVTNGAAVDIERVLIEEMGTAVSIDGAATNVDFKNNSFIANVNGLSATNCADLDVRNSIFAYNSGTALAYEACASIQRHEFNLFYANGTDQVPNDPGSGELFSNPLFLSYATGDYRVEAVSPVINAGSPGDAVPPGAGSRIDIGHIEQSGGSYIASLDYCSTCVNDGLIWSVNAFDTIQGAVDAAEEDLLNLFGGDGTPFTVGVDAGTYTESVTINWNLQLLGSDPNNTTIQGVGGPAVTISGTVGAKVSGFTLLGDGASPIGVHVTGGSSSIQLTRNLIKDNTTGTLFDGRSSGLVKFNTLVNNTTAIEATGQYNWADTNNNLVSANTNGLVASDSAAIFSDNNLLYNTLDYTNVITGINDINGSDPLVSGPYALLTLGSPAIDSGDVRERVPTGGGIAPDIGWHELTIPPISVLMGQADDSVATESYGVGAVEYAIVSVADPTSPVSSTLPATWTPATLDNPGEKLTYWNTTFTPTSTGYYRIYSRATDGLGNTETDSADWFDGAFYVDDTAPTVTISYDFPQGVDDSWLLVTGVVTDYVGTSFDIEDIYFTIDGKRYDGRWALDTWEADGTTGRSFHTLYMNDTGANQLLDIQAFAVDGAGHVGQSELLTDVFLDRAGGGFIYFDSTGPRITSMDIDDNEPTTDWPFTNNNLYSGTITFEGTALDWSDIDPAPPYIEGWSGIDGYQISFDGGLTWDTMERTVNPLVNHTHNGKILPYDWAIPGGLDATTIPVKIRATDYNGNSQTFVYTVTVDTAGPRMVGTINTDSGPAVGQHFDQTTLLDFSWIEPTDGSGSNVMLGEFGQTDPGLPPTAVQPTNTRIGAEVDEGGAWYAVVGAKDEAGNINWMWVGPWYAGQVIGVPWGGAIQSLDATFRDGYVDVAHDEYVVENEWLDTDSRRGAPLSLYNAWAYDSSYIGVVGADWDTDGTFFVYYDLEVGGTTQPISGPVTITLPFEADYALSFTGIITQLQPWRFDGVTWNAEPLSDSSGVDAATNGLQMVRYFGDYPNLELAANHRMMAYATDDSGNVWATFPRNNDLGGAFEYYFDWNVTPGNGDLLKLPTNAQLSDLVMVVDSDPAESAPLTNGSIVTTVVKLLNLSNNVVDGVQLQVTGSNGVTYQNVEGATCTACLPASSMLLDVAQIDGGETAVVTITSQLDSILVGLDTVTTTVDLVSTTTNKTSETVVHQLDLLPPEAGIPQHPGRAIGRWESQISGFASDAAGIGVDLVEFSTDEVNWQEAIGTEEWVADLDLTDPTIGDGSTVDVYVRTTDYYGQVSEPISITVVIDEVPPIITPTQLSLVGGSNVAYLTGVTRDPSPENAQVDLLQIRFDGAAEWQTIPLGIAGPNGERSWGYTWLLPLDDGVQHAYQYRAVDHAGNEVTTFLFTTVVDRVAPQLTLDTDLGNITTSNDVLTGTVTDGREVSSMSITIIPVTGTATTANIIPNPDGTWVYDLNQPVGDYTILISASDGLNNPRVIGPYTLNISGGELTAVDDLATTDEDTAITIDVLANDIDVVGSGLTIDAVTQPANGTVVNNGTDVSYMPNENFNGSDSFTYTIIDGDGNSATGTVTVTVNAINDNPVAADDGATTDVDTAVTIEVLANDSDVDGDILTVDSVTQPANGSVIIEPDGTVTYTPNAGFAGSDSFTYSINDGNGGSASATVTVMVNLGNSPPVAEAGGPYTVDEGDSVILDASGTTDAEQDPATLTYAWDLDGDGQYDDATGITTTLSALALDGPTTVTVALQVTDDGGLTSVDTADITILNLPPTVIDISYQPLPVIYGEVTTITVTASDPIDPINYAFDCDSDGSFEIGPQAANSALCAFASPGDITVNVQVSDDDGGITTSSIVVTVISQQEAIAYLQGDVQALADAGILNMGQVRGLNRTLDSAIKKLDQGNTQAAKDKLMEFITDLNEFVLDGVLTPEQAQPLIAEANRIIAAIAATE